MSYVELDGNILGRLQGWNPSKQANLVPVNFPGKNEDATQAIDTMGVTKYVIFRARLFGTFAQLMTIIGNTERIVNGLQDSSVYLRSPYVCAREYTDSSKTSTLLRRGIMGTITAQTFGPTIVIDTNNSFINAYTKVGDILINLVNQTYATVTAINTLTGNLTISSDIGLQVGTSYALTATMKVKVLNTDFSWDFPGLHFVDCNIHVMQVDF